MAVKPDGRHQGGGIADRQGIAGAHAPVPSSGDVPVQRH
jgi:hypothetical protein